MASRREFLTAGVAVGLGVLGESRVARAVSDRPRHPKPRHPLRILILGGTSFLGPHQVAYALRRGHSISTFTRGRTVPTVHRALFDDVEQLIGDREDDLTALRGRTWDAVIDNSGRQVSWTRDSATLLRDSADVYLYTSSTGVYYPYRGSDMREDTPLVYEVPDGLDEQTARSYDFGVMKANSEIEARRAFGEERTIIVRPTFMMGPADSTDRFTYWPVRLALGGEVFVPGRRDDPVQYIDARDVAGWMIRLIENRVVGAFNAVGPVSTTGMHQFVYGAHAAFSSEVTFVHADDHDFLDERGVRFAIPWIMPVGDVHGIARVNNELGIAHGLTLTPLAQSVRDIHAWWYSDAISQDRRTSLESGERSLMAKEAALIAAWKARG